MSVVAALLQERRAGRRSLEDLGGDVKAEAAVYWSREGQDAGLEQGIIRLAQKFRSCAVGEAQRYLDKSRVSEIKMRCARLHMECTGDDFGGAQRRRDTARVERVELEVERILACTEASWILGIVRRVFHLGR